MFISGPAKLIRHYLLQWKAMLIRVTPTLYHVTPESSKGFRSASRYTINIFQQFKEIFVNLPSQCH